MGVFMMVARSLHPGLCRDYIGSLYVSENHQAVDASLGSG